MEQNRNISTTFLKGLSVLKAFDDTQRHMTIADLSRKTNLDAATTRRLLLTLVHIGYVRKTARTFSLSPLVLVLAGSFLGANQFGRLVQPVLNRHAALIGRAIVLAIRDEERALIVAQSTLHTSNVSFGFTVGSRLPLFQTAIGRMLLACENPDVAATILASADVEKHTPQTVVDPDGLRAIVRTCATDMYSVVHGEFEAGVTGVAVPLKAEGDVKAVLGISDTTASFENSDAQQSTINDLRRCSLEMAHTNLF